MYQIASWRSRIRSFRPFRVFAKRSLRGPFDRRQFIAAFRRAKLKAEGAGTLHAKTVGLWELERIAFAYTRHGTGDLTDDAISLSSRPIAHVGLGVAVSEMAALSADRICELIGRMANPNFRSFCFESAGAVWAVKANRPMGLILAVLSQTKVGDANLDSWRRFTEPFPHDVSRMMAHGYGRALYFKHCHIGNAIEEACRIDGLDNHAAVQGMAFAFAMLNHEDLDKVLDTRAIHVGGGKYNADFEYGLCYALAFWEWTYPGLLHEIQTLNAPQRSLVDRARDLIDQSSPRRALCACGQFRHA